ncbi:MAG: lipid-A-disaccharide synthase [Planctomycetota bacterium]|nr:MAG: lipid-A-disaccharide synthase [Planctomycetota bacterium]
MPRLFFSAGDTSGDQHAARLLTALRERVPELRAEGLGGPELAAAGMTLHHDLVAGAIMGLGPAVAAVPQLLGLLRKVAKHFDRERPDRVVLVDYPGLNLQIARLAKRRGIPVSYFVAPQLWAWAPWRARRFARAIDEALVIFPFEVPFFATAGLPAHYIGHPLLDALPQHDCTRPEITERVRPVALLPGSRRREVRDNMPLLLDAAELLTQRHPELSFHCAHVSSEQRERITDMARGRPIDFTLHDADVHGVMASCRCAAVASGTATLETGMLGTPLVVFYRISAFEARVAQGLLVPEFIGQVNLMSGRALTPELRLPEHDPETLAAALEPLLHDGDAWQAQRAGLDTLRASQRGKGSAVERAARHLAAHFATA